MIRVLRIVGRMNVGGPARCVLNLAAGLARSDFETLVATGQPGPGEGDLAEGVAAAGVTLERIRGMGRELSVVKDLVAFFAIRRLIASFRPHIVHTHTSKAGVLGRLAAVLARRESAASRTGPVPRIVHTFHGHVLDGYFGPWKSSLFREAERWLAARTDAIIAVADSVRRELVGRHGVGRLGQYRVIPSGGHLAVSPPTPSRATALRAEVRAEFGLSNGPVAGVVGRMVPVKGHDLLIAALGTVLEAVPALEVLAVGDGPLRKKYEAAAARRGLGGAIHYVGNRSDVDRILGALDLLVLPSRKEGLPTVLLEAAGAGVPVVAADIPSVNDLFRHESSALLFEPESSSGLACAMVRLCSDGGLRRKLSAGAQRAVERSMTPKEVVEAHAALYKSLCSQPTEDV